MSAHKVQKVEDVTSISRNHFSRGDTTSTSRQRLVEYSSNSSDSDRSVYYRSKSRKRHSSRSGSYGSERSRKKMKRRRSHEEDEQRATSSTPSTTKAMMSPRTQTTSASPAISEENYKQLSLSLVEETNSKNAKKIAEAVQLLPYILNKKTQENVTEKELPTSTSSNDKKLTEAVQLLPYIFDKTVPPSSNACDTVVENSCVIKSTIDGFEIRLNTSEKRVLKEEKTISKVVEPSQHVDLKANVFKEKSLNTSSAYKIALANQKSQKINPSVPQVSTNKFEAHLLQSPSTISSLPCIFDEDKKPVECLSNLFHQDTPTNRIVSDNKRVSGVDLVHFVDFSNPGKKECFPSHPIFTPTTTACIVKQDWETVNSPVDIKHSNLSKFNEPVNFFESIQPNNNLFDEPKDLFADADQSINTTNSSIPFNNLFQSDSSSTVETKTLNNLFQSDSSSTVETETKTKNYLPPENINIFESHSETMNIPKNDTVLCKTENQQQSYSNIFESPPKNVQEKTENSSVPKDEQDKLKSKILDHLLPAGSPSKYCVIPNFSLGSEIIPYIVIDVSVPPPFLYNPASSLNKVETQPSIDALDEHLASGPLTECTKSSKVSEIQIHPENASQICIKNSTSSIIKNHNQDLTGHKPDTGMFKYDSNNTSNTKNERPLLSTSRNQRDPRSHHRSTREVPQRHHHNPRPSSNIYGKNIKKELYVVPSRRTTMACQESSSVINRCIVSSPTNIPCNENWDEPDKYDSCLYRQSPVTGFLGSTNSKSTYRYHQQPINKIQTITREAESKTNDDFGLKAITAKQETSLKLSTEIQDNSKRRVLPRFTPVRAPPLASQTRNTISFTDVWKGPKPEYNRPTTSNIIQQETLPAPLSSHSSPCRELKEKMQTVECESTQNHSNVIKITSFPSNTIKNKPSTKRSKQSNMNKKKQKVSKIKISKVKSLKELASKSLAKNTKKQVSVKCNAKNTPSISKIVKKQKVHIKCKMEINSDTCVLTEELPMLTRSRKKLQESFLKNLLTDVTICHGAQEENSSDKQPSVAIKKETDSISYSANKKTSSKKEKRVVTTKQKKVSFLPDDNVSQIRVKTKAELKYYPPELNFN